MQLILCYPLLLLLSIFPTIRSFPVSQVFTSGSQSIGSFSFNISPSNEYSGLISFRMNWLDILAVQGRSNQSILKEISPEYSLEGLMLKLKLQYFGYLM